MRSRRLALIVAAGVLLGACGGRAANRVAPAGQPIGSVPSTEPTTQPAAEPTTVLTTEPRREPSTDPASQCLSLVEQPWTPSTASPAPIDAIRNDRVPGLPGGSSAHVVDVREYATPESYVDTSPGILHADLRIETMHRDGYVAGVVVTYASSLGEYDVTVLQFAANGDAIDYSKVHLRDACQQVVRAERLSDGSGLVYTRTDGSTRAVVVAGDSEISFCGCFHGDDPSRIAADAAQNVYGVLTNTSA